MATIDSLVEATIVGDDDLLLIDQGGEGKKLKKGNLKIDADNVLGANGRSVQDFIDGLAAPDSDVLVGGVAAGSLIKPIASVAALRTTQGFFNGQQVSLTGYYDGWAALAEPPKGGGRLVWDATSTAADDGGVVFAVTGVATGRWKRAQEKYWTPEMFGAKCDGVTNDSSAINALTTYLKSIGGGTILLSSGVYIANDINLHGGIKLIGPGRDYCEIRDTSGAGYCVSINRGSGGTPNPEDNEKDIEISGIHFSGPVATLGFSEQRHLLNFNAVTNLHLHHCKISGFRGDGIYLGSSNVAGVERHNVDVKIEHNVFDGINKNNRNGVSVIDGTRVKIRHNTFMNCSRPDMPGPIDVEPNGNLFARVVDIDIQDNRFSNCGGEGGLIGFLLPNAYEYTVPPRKFVVHNNFADGTNTARQTVFFRAYNRSTGGTLVDLTVTDFELSIKGNTADSQIAILGVRGFKVEDNTLGNNNSNNGTVLALGSPTKAGSENVLSGEVLNNKFNTDGNIDGIVLIGNAADVKLNDNRFYNPGVNGRAFALYGAGVTTVSSGLEFKDNKFDEGFTNPFRVSSHTVSAASNVIGGNRYISGGLVPVASALIGYKNPYDELNITAQESYTSAKLPDSFRIGETVSLVNGDAGLPDNNEQGVLRTVKLNGGASFRKFVTQWFYPANNTTVGDPVDDYLKEYWRKGNASTNTWSKWVLVTGTQVV